MSYFCNLIFMWFVLVLGYYKYPQAVYYRQQVKSEELEERNKSKSWVLVKYNKVLWFSKILLLLNIFSFDQFSPLYFSTIGIRARLVGNTIVVLPKVYYSQGLCGKCTARMIENHLMELRWIVRSLKLCKFIG